MKHLLPLNNVYKNLIAMYIFSPALPPKSEEDVISNGVPGKKIAKVEDEKEVKKKSKSTEENDDDELQYIEQTVGKRSDVNNFDESAENIANEQQKSFKSSVSKSQSSKLNSSRENSSRRGKNSNLPNTAFTNNKDDIR